MVLKHSKLTGYALHYFEEWKYIDDSIIYKDLLRGHI